MVKNKIYENYFDKIFKKNYFKLLFNIIILSKIIINLKILNVNLF